MIGSSRPKASGSGRRFAALVIVAVLAASCGGNGDDGGLPEAIEAAEETAPDIDALPEGCVPTPFAIDFEIEGVAELTTSEFRVVTAIAQPTPIVPDPDGELSADDLETTLQQAAETDLVLYTVWIADFEFTAADLGLLSGPTPPEGGTVLGLTIVPTTEAGLQAGEVVVAGQEIQYDTQTTFATLGTYLDTARSSDLTIGTVAPFVGRAEILVLDEEQICLNWDDGGILIGGEGTWRVSGVVLAELAERASLPFT